MEKLADEADVIFTATPQGYCASLINEAILSKKKVIDLSADFRIKDVDIYEQWYKIRHQSPQFMEEAVYGLPEVNRENIKNARLVANPGCYPTFISISSYLYGVCREIFIIIHCVQIKINSFLENNLYYFYFYAFFRFIIHTCHSSAL